jgi:glutamate--cysteine ligase
MAFAVASQVDPARLADGEFASASAAAQFISDSCLADGPVGRVGLEIEAHCYDPAEPQRRPSWDEITDVLESLPAMPGDSLVTVEPGGAVELSGPPALGATAAIEAMAGDQAVLRKAFAAAGLGLVSLGADPLRPAKRVNPGPRYRAMEEFFTASNTGAAGAAMMTSTASVQVNLDAGPADGWADRVQLAHALRQLAIAQRAVLRMAFLPAAGVESTRLGALRSDPDRERGGSRHRLGALRAQSAGHVGAFPGSSSGHPPRAVCRLG